MSSFQSLSLPNYEVQIFIPYDNQVPGTGLEPAHRKALGSKPSVSTSSTIPAEVDFNTREIGLEPITLRFRV